MERDTRIITNTIEIHSININHKISARYLFALVVSIAAVAVLGVYFTTLAPTITWRNGGADSGELAAAVAELGIAHPPGYPAYVLLGHLWSRLPLGAGTAYRLNLLSAVSATIAGLMAMLLIAKLLSKHITDGVARAVGVIFGGTLLAFSPLVWSQAIITEVYAPGLMLVALATFVLLRKKQPSTTEYGAAGVLLGFGAGILPQIILLLPGIFLLSLCQRCATPKNRLALKTVARQWLTVLVGVAIGATVFLWLPLRAAAHPAANWGNPVTAAHFWALVSARQYHHLILQPTFSEWVFRLGQSMAAMVQQISWAGVLFAGWGGVRLWHTARPKMLFLLVFLSATLLFRSGYPVEGNAVYLVPALYVLAVLAGYGMADGIVMAHRYIGATAQVVGMLLLVGLVWRAAAVYPLVNLHSDWQAYRFGQQILAELPAGAAVVTDRDETTFSLWYLQSQGVRRDVTVVDNRLLFYDWYVQNLVARAPALQASMLQPDAVTIPGRPVFLLSTPIEFSADSFVYQLKRNR